MHHPRPRNPRIENNWCREGAVWRTRSAGRGAGSDSIYAGNLDGAGTYDFGSSATGSGYAGRGPKGYQRSDDRVREDVCEQLESADDVDASEIEVEVHQGEVILKGTVPDRAMKRCAEDCVSDVRGVRDVHNQITVGKREAPQPSKDGQAGRHGSTA